MSVLTESPRRLAALSRQFEAAIGQAQTYRDPDLTPDGLRKLQAEKVAEVRAQLRPQLDAARRELEATVHDLERQADEHRPRVNPADPASIAMTEARWRQVREQLDAGVNLAQIIATGDDATLAAIADNAGPYLQAKTAKTHPSGLSPAEPIDTAGIRKMIDERIIATGGLAAEAVKRAREAAIAWAGAEPHLNHMAAMCNGSAAGHTALSAAIESHVAQGFAAQTATPAVDASE